MSATAAVLPSQETTDQAKQLVSLSFVPSQVRSSIIDEEQRIVRAIISTSDIDRYNTIVDPAGLEADAFVRTGGPVLWDHGFHAPIGSVPIGNAIRLFAENNRIIAEWKFASFDGQPVERWGPHAKFVEDIWYLYKHGHLGAYSISFLAKEVEHGKKPDDPLIYRQWELVEFSLVSLPANPHAIVFDEKACRLFRRCVGPQKAADLLQRAVNEEIANRAQEVAGRVVRTALSQERAINMAIAEVQRAVRVQSLVFDKEKFSQEEAIAWAKEHNFRADKVDETANSWRLRQFDPEICRKDSFGTREIVPGVLAVFCEVPDDKDKNANAAAPVETLDKTSSATQKDDTSQAEQNLAIKVREALNVEQLLETNAMLAQSVHELTVSNAQLSKENALLRKIAKYYARKNTGS